MRRIKLRAKPKYENSFRYISFTNVAFAQHCLYCLSSLRDSETSHPDFGYCGANPLMFGLLMEFIDQ